MALPQYTQYKLIYRRYAGLFFTLCVDQEDNELVYFESIHLFVELLDQFFGNVCELDLVFNFNKACARAPRSPPRPRPLSLASSSRARIHQRIGGPPREPQTRTRPARGVGAFGRCT